MTTNVGGNVVPDPPETMPTRRNWPRFRFRLRTLLMLPVVVAVLLLVAFPKLLTGDFVEGKVVSIHDYGEGVSIEIDARISSGTDWGATNDLPGGALGVSGDSRPHWTHILPTWPRHLSMTINVHIDRAILPPDANNLADMLLIKQGETYYVTPDEPLDLIHGRFANGEEGRCRFEPSYGSRLGL